MHRFYCPNIDLSLNSVSIKQKEELHHLKNVLRLKKNTKIQIFNGNGEEAQGTLTQITNNEAKIKISHSRIIPPKNPLLILACAIPKKSKFELIQEVLDRPYQQYFERKEGNEFFFRNLENSRHNFEKLYQSGSLKFKDEFRIRNIKELVTIEYGPEFN